MTLYDWLYTAHTYRQQFQDTATLCKYYTHDTMHDVVPLLCVHIYETQIIDAAMVVLRRSTYFWTNKYVTILNVISISEISL